MNRDIITFLLAIVFAICANAQIGYQVALLNTATGEARANETVSVSLTISNSAGTAIYSGSQTATTNEFGILSLSVGDATTFDGVDWSKLPFYISATVDGTLIGKTQILNVPVAEYAKRTGVLTKEILCSKTWHGMLINSDLSFFSNGSGSYIKFFLGVSEREEFTWYIEGNLIICIPSNGMDASIYRYFPLKNMILSNGGGEYFN